MKKAILFFVLLILFLSFGAFLLNAFILQKNYFDNLKTTTPTEPPINVVEEKSTPSSYADYSKEGYEKAIDFKGIVVLYFTSNWCQQCINQDEINNEVFTDLVSENVSNVFGLRVHILDSETTTESDALSQKFDVYKEQSYVILDKNGVVYFKNTGLLPKEQLKQKILEVINK